MKPEDIRDAMGAATTNALIRGVERRQVVTLLDSFGAAKVSNLDRSKWVDYLEAVQALQPPPVRTATLHVDYAIGARVETRVAKTQLKVVGYEVRYIMEREDGREYALGESLPASRLAPATKVPEAPTPWTSATCAPPIKAPTDLQWSLHAEMFPDAHATVEKQLGTYR